ncbi:putative anti-sigma-F factor NrsF [Burkholderiales bacterium 8X]|nr:putative anti-sigma-F factor NrsF [Burkholderiales bacterium 8X]
MKTDRLIEMLATGVEPVRPGAASRRLAASLLVGLPLAVGWMLFEYGIRRDLIQSMFYPMFWIKLLFPISVAFAAFVWAQRAARPGAPVSRSIVATATPFVLMVLLGLGAWLAAPSTERPALVLGQTWRSCVFNIAAISLPIFVAAMIAMKGLAPTSPSLAGAAAGLMASGAGAAVYALHCPELAAPFLAVWYVIGMLLPAAVGASIGSRLLRWA